MFLLGVGENYDAAARIFKPVFDQIHNSIQQSQSSTTSASTAFISSKCNQCKLYCQQHNVQPTPSHTPMSINQLSIAEVFIAADMKMMRMLIGCQPSAACKCFCPMCLVTHDDALPGLIHAPVLLPPYSPFRLNRSHSFLARTTQSQNDHYNAFTTLGQGNISKAMQYGNVIHPPLISTEIHQHLAPLPLHVLLGTTKNAIDIISDMCVALDEQLKQVMGLPLSSTPTPSVTQINTAIRTSLHNVQAIQHTVECAQTQQQSHAITTREWQLYQQLIDDGMKRIKEEDKLLTSLDEKWDECAGYFSRALDHAITKLKVRRQRYHGGAFVGNDCIRLLDGREIIANVLNQQQFISLYNNAQHTIGSSHQSDLALGLLSRLHSLHQIYSAARPLCNHEIESFCYNAYEFGHWFPINFPKHRITPKMHVMIYHMPELAVRYRTIGMFSEQAGEAIHTVFNKLDRQYVYMGSDVKRLEATMKRCMRLHDPRVLAFVRPQRNMCKS